MTIRLVNTPAARFKRAMLVVVLLAGGIILAPQAFAGGPEDVPAVPVETDTYTVASGETLWSIASDLTVPGADVRHTMAAIKQLNAMDDADLMAGEQLLIPSLG